MALAGDIIIIADKDAEFINNIITVSAIKSFLEGQHFMCTEKVTGKVMRALTEVSRNGFKECFQKL
jgi:hypothetical protein